jgi:hypothetical protein
MLGVCVQEEFNFVLVASVSKREIVQRWHRVDIFGFRWRRIVHSSIDAHVIGTDIVLDSDD